MGRPWSGTIIKRATIVDQNQFDPTPNVMVIGSANIMPPKLAVYRKNISATITKIIPTKTKKTPSKNNLKSSLDCVYSRIGATLSK